MDRDSQQNNDCYNLSTLSISIYPYLIVISHLSWLVNSIRLLIYMLRLHTISRLPNILLLSILYIEHPIIISHHHWQAVSCHPNLLPIEIQIINHSPHIFHFARFSISQNESIFPIPIISISVGRVYMIIQMFRIIQFLSHYIVIQYIDDVTFLILVESIECRLYCFLWFTEWYWNFSSSSILFSLFHPYFCSIEPRGQYNTLKYFDS